MEAESAYVLCHTDGRIVAGNIVWERWLAESGATDETLADAAARLVCPALLESFQQFCAGTMSLAAFPVNMGKREQQLRLQRLGELILLEIAPAPDGVAESRLAQIGRLTARLIHDFRNQLGGLKLYAAYLKKLLAQAEAAEARAESQDIAGKIIASLDAMAEHATLVNKLAKPVELRVEPGDLVALVEQLIAAQAQHASERGVLLASDLIEDLPEFQFDPQQLRVALQPLLARAIAVTPAGSVVEVELQNQGGGCVLQITDQGPTLDAAQRQKFFDLLTNERLNKNALDLALAKRIIEAHGGTVEVGNAATTSTVVRVGLKAVNG
jgi:signal transduction histidine kinase